MLYLLADCDFSDLQQDGYDGYYDRRFEESRDLYERRYSGLPPRGDMGMRGGRGDFLPPPLPPRREPLPPMPSIGLRGPPSSSMSGGMRDSSFARGGSDYGMFSRRSPQPSGGAMPGSRMSRMYEDFSRDSFDDRR